MRITQINFKNCRGFPYQHSLKIDQAGKNILLLCDEILQAIARELVQTVRRSVTIDWTVKESVRAKLRTTVKRLLRKYGYPPDKQEKATLTVLQQAESLCKDWAA